MSSRIRASERDSDFTWEEPYSGGGGSGRRRRTAGPRTPRKRPGGGGSGPRMVALPVVVVALVAGLLVGYLVGGGGGTTTVTETATVTTSAEPAAPAASGPESRPDIVVAVLNGSDQDGLAARTGERLRDRARWSVLGAAPTVAASTAMVVRRDGRARCRNWARCRRREGTAG